MPYRIKNKVYAILSCTPEDYSKAIEAALDPFKIKACELLDQAQKSDVSLGSQWLGEIFKKVTRTSSSPEDYRQTILVSLKNKINSIKDFDALQKISNVSLNNTGQTIKNFFYDLAPLLTQLNMLAAKTVISFPNIRDAQENTRLLGTCIHLAIRKSAANSSQLFKAQPHAVIARLTPLNLHSDSLGEDLLSVLGQTQYESLCQEVDERFPIGNYKIKTYCESQSSKVIHEALKSAPAFAFFPPGILPIIASYVEEPSSLSSPNSKRRMSLK